MLSHSASIWMVPGQSISRILSSTAIEFTSEDFILEPMCLGGHLSGPAISHRLGAANPGLRRSGQLLVPAWPCSWRRLPDATIAACISGLLHHYFNLTACAAVCFCGPTGRLSLVANKVGSSGQAPAPGFSPAPCPVECGLSSA